MDLWLIRHPRPMVAPDTCYGQLDIPVARDELEAACDRLVPALPADARMRTSPASRCRDLARRLHPAPIEDARLRERNFGDWEGLTWDHIGRSALDAWAADPWDFAPPGGESARDLLDRVLGALEEELAIGDRVVWVTHQGVIRAVAGQLLGLPENRWMTLTQDFGAALRLARQPAGWHRVPAVP
jgi:alpha-ribazole phosphatase